MGKGDQKTARGKRKAGSYGKTRQKKSSKPAVAVEKPVKAKAEKAEPKPKAAKPKAEKTEETPATEEKPKTTRKKKTEE